METTIATNAQGYTDREQQRLDRAEGALEALDALRYELDTLPTRASESTYAAIDAMRCTYAVKVGAVRDSRRERTAT